MLILSCLTCYINISTIGVITRLISHGYELIALLGGGGVGGGMTP